MEIAIAIITAIANGIPKLVKLIKSGKNPADIKLGEFISTDALKVLQDAKADQQDFIDNG